MLSVRDFKKCIRQAVADYIHAEVIYDHAASAKHEKALAKLLNASYPDDSGFDFNKFKSKA